MKSVGKKVDIKNLVPNHKPAIKLRERLYLACIFIIACLIYSNTLSNEYALDDKAVLTQNQYTLQGFEGIKDLVTHDHFFGYKGATSGLYRPLPLITHAIEYQLLGLNSFVSHLINILLYALSCVLLYILFRKFLKEEQSLAIFIGVILFTVHPIHTEVVANIKGRDDLLALVFILLSMFLFVDYTLNNRLIIYFGGLITFTLAALSKESSLTFVLVIPVCLYFFTKASIKKMVIVGVVLFLIALVYYYVRSQYISTATEYRFLDSYFQYANDRSIRLATGLANMLDYFKLLVFPFPLIYDYSYNHTPLLTWSHWKVLLSIVILCLLFITFVYGFYRKHSYSFAIYFYFATIALSSNLLTPNQAIFAERYLFLPSIGVFLFVSVLLARLNNFKDDRPYTIFEIIERNKFIVGILTGVFITFTFCTYQRNFDWKNDQSLFTSAIKYAPSNARVHYNLGSLFVSKFTAEVNQDTEENFINAERYLLRCVAIDSNFYDSYFTLGILYNKHKDYLKSAYNFERCLKISTDASGDYSAENALFYAGLGYTSAGKFKQALNMNLRYIYFPEIKRAKQIGNMPFAYNNAGNAYMQLKQYDSAIVYLKESIKLNPNNETSLNNIVLCYNQINKNQESVDYFDSLTTENPKNTIIKKYRGLCYFNKKDYKKTVDLYLSFINDNPQDAYSLYYLGLSYYYMGSTENAKIYISKAAELEFRFKEILNQIQ